MKSIRFYQYAYHKLDTICKGSGKLPVTQQPKAESHGEEMIGKCPTCHGKGEVDK